MRIGIRFGGVIALVVVIASSSGDARGAGAERVRPVPLGGTLPNQVGDQFYGTYVPTRFGGILTVKTTSGTVEALTGPDGKSRANGEDTGEGQHGWYTFKVVGADKAKAYTVETSFVQIGQASRKPWNFYYWPTKGDCVHEPWGGGNGRVDTAQPVGDDIQVKPYGSYVAPGEDIVLPGADGILQTPPSPGDESTWFPNLYDDTTWRGGDGTWYNTPSPLLKYDQLFGVRARRWESEQQQNREITRWPGHCLGGAIASIMLNEPQPGPASGLTQDELKALWAELGENHLNHRIGDNVNNVPAGPPRPGYDETDGYAPRVHGMLERHLRGRRQGLLGNLRGFPPTGKPNEVWNHGIGKYTAKVRAVPGQSPRTVQVELELVANSGSNLNEGDPGPRVNLYRYIVTYGVDGNVDESGTGYADWQSVGGESMFAPLNIMEVVESRWSGHNPMVTESNVRALDMANGGGGGRFAVGTAPTFRPVGSYDPGSGTPMFARGGLFGDRESDMGAPSQPRRGLFRALFGGR